MLYKSVCGLDMFDICALAIEKLSNQTCDVTKHIQSGDTLKG